MDNPQQRIVCQWCKSQNRTDALTCRACGAPLDVRDMVSASGWKETPKIKDMTMIHFGKSTCQVDGEVVPVAEMDLAEGDSVYFEHHTLLWADEYVNMGVLPLKGMVKRMIAGMPVIVTFAEGPGRIAFSRDDVGELVILPLHPGMEIDVREHAFVVASHHIDYSYVRLQGLSSIRYATGGMYLDRFVTGNTRGLLILHGYGNVFEKTLGPEESILIEPGAFLYKDSSVEVEPIVRYLRGGFFNNTSFYLARMYGPGRVGIQSMYVHPG